MPSKSKKPAASPPSPPSAAVADAANPSSKPKKSKTPKVTPSSPTPVASPPSPPPAAVADAANPSSKPKKSKTPKVTPSSPTPAASPPSPPPAAVADAANPSSKPKKSKTPKVTPFSPTPAAPAAPAAAAGDAAPLSPSRKSDRKRKATSFPDDAWPASTGAVVRYFSDADVDILLRAVHRFRLATGAVPAASTIGAFYDTVKPSLSANITQDQVFNKIRTLRKKFRHHTAAGQTDSPFYRLAADAWAHDTPSHRPGSSSNTKPGDVVRFVKVEAEVSSGSDEKEDGEAGELVLVRRNLGEYCRKNGLPVELMEEGLRLVPPYKARALERGWRQKRDTDMKLMAEQCELDKEVYLLFRAI